ncbi:MAG: sugar-transfer associated ATP-grasp domain-containing protein [Candidatus Moranbacteria bacterium]|nr:sugar-transfer associated ATP-grasp domain-containing protein [Candidatus Moranbacteria bacterium]
MFEFFKNSRKLLGMNSRNLEFIRPFNRAKAKRLADNKMRSKRVLKKNGISVSKLIATIKTIEDLENFDWQKLPNSFALKPNRGFGGEGIVVVYGKKKGRDDAWVKADRSLITIEDLVSHIRNILDGSFSLSNTPDFAFFEERLQLLKLFKPYSYKGIPDIRVIVFNKIPVMAMLRLPTKESGGKANLHQGAIGVGIDLATGVTTTAIQNNRLIEKIPGTQLSTSGLRIPYWKDILFLATKAQEISGLGYLGADIAIDKENGPTILELNARPGLAIQVANLAGLAERLKRVSGIKIKTVEKGVRVGMDLFGGEIEEELEEISGRKVIGTVEKVKITGKNGKEVEVEARIDTGAGISAISKELAIELGFDEAVRYWEEFNLDKVLSEEEIQKLSANKTWKELEKHPDIVGVAKTYSAHGATYRIEIKVSLLIDNLAVLSKLSISNRSGLAYPILIGRRDLNKFLIDVKK